MRAVRLLCFGVWRKLAFSCNQDGVGQSWCHNDVVVASCSLGGGCYNTAAGRLACDAHFSPAAAMDMCRCEYYLLLLSGGRMASREQLVPTAECGI